MNTEPVETKTISLWDKVKGPIAFLAIGYFAGVMTSAYTRRKFLPK
jgi:hypothetical protein